MTILNLTAGSPALAQIKSITSTKDYVNVPARSLAKTDKEGLALMFPKVFGRELADDDQVLSVQFENGRYKRSYPLSVSQDESGNLVSRIGLEVVPIILEGNDVTISGITLDKYEDPCLVFSIEDGDDFIELPMPLRFTREAGEALREDGEYNYRKLAKLVSKPAKIAENLRVAKEVSSSGGNSTMLDMSSLPEYTPIKINSSREVNTSYGKSYIINITNPETNESGEVWAPFAMKEWLSLGATVGPDTQFQFYSYQNKKGKTSYNCEVDGLIWAQTEDRANLDLSLFQ